MDTDREMQRFETEQEARVYAQRVSRQKRDVRYVVESPPSPTEPATDVGRFVVDTDGFTRLWERSIATYENGKLDN